MAPRAHPAGRHAGMQTTAGLLLLQCTPAGDARQSMVLRQHACSGAAREAAPRAPQRLLPHVAGRLHRLALADVALHRHKVGHPAGGGVTNGGDGDLGAARRVWGRGWGGQLGWRDCA